MGNRSGSSRARTAVATAVTLSTLPPRLAGMLFRRLVERAAEGGARNAAAAVDQSHHDMQDLDEELAALADRLGPREAIAAR